MAKKRPRDGAELHPPASPEATKAPSPSHAGEHPKPLKLVAVGSSAGGLTPLKDFFSSLPSDSGMAFIVVQHLAPDSPSLLSEILAAKIDMPVVQVNEDLVPEPNHVYVIAPNSYLAFRAGKLCTTPPPPQARLRLPIDFLLRSLAEESGSDAAAIILSGTGSDGTLGVEAIRGAGGLTIVQEPSTAEYDDMPRHAIATGLVDLVLPVEEMGQALMKHANHPFLHKAAKAKEIPEHDTGTLEAILTIIRERGNSDFRWYRKSALLRRIARRMGIIGVESLEAYKQTLEKNSDEATELVRDLLIGVTSFFRDTAAFEELDHLVIRPLVREKDPAIPVRVWTAGCGSGEEAYSIAMLLFEALEAEGKSCKLQIFATDLDERSLQKARAGIYPLSIAEDVSAQRLERFFIRSKDFFQIKKELRETIVFAAHNLVADPPFCRMDLVTCRNLLIYVEADVQKKIIALFHFTLASHGYLFLGKAESTAGRTDLFEPINSDFRILRRQDAPRLVELELPVYARAGRRQGHVNHLQQPPRDQQALEDILKSVLLSHFGAAVVLIDPSGRITRFLGRLDRYLSISSGEVEMNLLDMAREGLAGSLRPSVRDAINSKEPQILLRVPIKEEKEEIFLADVTVLPVAYPENAGVLVAVVLERARTKAPETLASGESPDGSAVERLERELHLTQEDLRRTIAELQSANEELKVVNEEATSMNEEMQSTNEELETSKEELQSINEELTSVNSELQEKLAELNAANSDMSNLLTSTAIATVFLDGDLNIRFFTPPAGELLNLRPTDKGRPISHFANNLLDLDLNAEAAKIQASGKSNRREIRGRDGRWHMVHLLAYEAGNQRHDGVIATFTDITELKVAEEKTRRLAAVMTDSNDAVLLVDTEGKVQEWNRGAQKMYGWTAREAVGKTLFDLTPAKSAESPATLLAKLSRGEDVRSFETRRLCKDGNVIDVWLTVSTLSPGTDAPVIALTERDLTEHKQHTRALQERAKQLQRLTSEVVLAEQRERRRLASILHDHLQQLLVGAKFGLNVLHRQVDEGGKKAVDQVDDLLDQAISASRSLSVELSPPILHEAGLAAGLDWLARWMHEKHGLNVDLHADKELVVPREDVRLLLFQSVRELLLNVVKHAKVTTAIVELTRHDAKNLHVVVADSGVGFDPTQAFTCDLVDGGLGLYSIRERMTMMGGSVEIESSPGAGSRFVLIAPIDQKPHTMRQPAQATANAYTPVAAQSEENLDDDTTHIRVLLADDHAMVRQGLVAILSATDGIVVVGQAADGLKAIEQARKLNPDIVLMDSSMPIMDGVEATRRLHKEMPHIQIIGLSMYQESERAATMKEAGAVAYVSKSDASNTLVDLIMKVHAQRPTT